MSYANHDRILDAAAKKNGWKHSTFQAAYYGNPAIREYWSEEAGLNHLDGDSLQGPVLEVYFNAGGYTIGVNLKQGVCGKVVASTGNLKERKAKERLAIAEQFILDHPLKERVE